MKPSELILRCYAEYKNGQWSICCLDLTLATQADTFQEAKVKIEAMINEYLYDALAGEDKEYSEQLLSRRAPISEWLKYYWLKLLIKLHCAKDGVYRLFKESIPLVPEMFNRKSILTHERGLSAAYL